METVIWIGAGGNHEPGNEHPCTLCEGISWHFKKNHNTLFNFLKNNYKLIYGNPLNFKVKRNELYFQNNNITNQLPNARNLFLTWNYGSIKENEKKQLQLLEKYFTNKHPSIKIINPISKLDYLYYKNVFFDEINFNNLSKFVPKYKILKSKSDIEQIGLHYPFIIKANNLSGGAGTFLVNNQDEAVKAFNKLKFYKIIGPFVDVFLKNFNFDKIIAVEYFDTQQPNIGLYITFRAFFFGDNLYFAYPHVSLKNWCIHTDMKEDNLSSKKYLKACELTNEVVRKNINILKSIKKIINIDTMAIDFLITKEGIIKVLEVELKYGPDKNFIEGQEKRFNLDNSHYNWIQKEIGAESVKFNQLFT